MSFIEDQNRLGFKPYREHSASVPIENKAVKKGGTISDQSLDDGQYTLDNFGDEVSWVYWDKNTREFGSWAQVFTVVMGETGVYPIAGQSLAPDTSFEAKEVITTTASNDLTKVRAIDGNVPNEGEFGLVFQAANQDTFELVFVPISSNPIKVDHANTPDFSTIIYDVLAGGAIDPANKGKTKDFLYIYGNFAHILTSAKFYAKDGNSPNVDDRKGALDFLNQDLPAIAEPASPTKWPVYLAFDTGTSLWKWWAEVDTGATLQVDWTTVDNHSTQIFETEVDGDPDASNVGTLKDFLYNEDNFTYIHTEAKFRLDTDKKGAITFQDEEFPTLAPPEETPFIVESKVAFDTGTSKWRIYTRIGGGSGEGASIAKIRWNFDLEQDLSEGEILTYNSTTNAYSASGTAIWVDRTKVLAYFATAGDNAVFRVAKIKDDHSRQGITRHLYRVVGIEGDNGLAITHLRTLKRNRLLQGEIHSDEVTGQNPWVNPANSVIKTSILGIYKVNYMLCRMPAEWNALGGTDFYWLEASDLSRGLPFYFRPIRPQLDDLEQKRYKSGETTGSENTPVALYTRK